VEIKNTHSKNTNIAYTTVMLNNVKPVVVMMYGSECWRIIRSDVKKLEVFHNKCLPAKNTGNIYATKICTEDLLKKCKCHSVATEMKRRRFRWLGHKIAYLKWSCAGLHLERENVVDLVPPGGEPCYQNYRTRDTV
jgi:hypothetical protein